MIVVMVRIRIRIKVGARVMSGSKFPTLLPIM
jgi:hypothetical protein